MDKIKKFMNDNNFIEVTDCKIAMWMSGDLRLWAEEYHREATTNGEYLRSVDHWSLLQANKYIIIMRELGIIPLAPEYLKNGQLVTLHNDEFELMPNKMQKKIVTIY